MSLHLLLFQRFICLFLAVVGFRCCTYRLSLVAGTGVYSLIVVPQLLAVVAC